MTNEKIARKLAHLNIKNELGKISPTSFKGEITKIGRSQKYPREIGMLAKQAARSVADIVSEYKSVDYLEVNNYADTMIVSGSELHLVRLIFSDEDIDDFKSLDTETVFAYYEIKDLFSIKTVAQTIIDINQGVSNMRRTPITIFLKGD